MKLNRPIVVLAAVLFVGALVFSGGVGALSGGEKATGNDSQLAGTETETNGSVELNTTHRDRQNHWNGDTAAFTQNKIERVTVVMSVDSTASDRLEALRQRGATIDQTSDGRVQAVVSASQLSTYREIPWVSSVRRPYVASTQTISEGVESMAADDAKQAGKTGENVKVGVIDSGFDPSNSEIEDNVAATKSFTGDITNGGRSKHGTAVSEIVTDVAPDSELYLANIDTGVEFSNALDWLESQDVDVISISLGFKSQPQDGTGLIAESVDEAGSKGILVSVSAGNEALSHWQGEGTDGDGDEFVEFENGDRANYIADGGTYSGPLRVTAIWDDWPNSDQDYDLFLVRASDDTVVASSTASQSGSQAPFETIRGNAPQARYYIVVKQYDVSQPQTLEIFVNGRARPLTYVNGRSSLTSPATAKKATTVGAYGVSTDSLESYTSQGPTGDGRTGVDVTGPTGVTTTAYSGAFYGTSASAPHVAGLAALLEGADSGLSRAEIEQAMEQSAIDIGPSGEDVRSGYGRVDAVAALKAIGAYQTESASVTGFSLDSSTIQVGEQLGGTITVDNPSSSAQDVDLTVYTDGDVDQRLTTTVAGESTKTVDFSVSFDSEGMHTVGVNGLPNREVTVEAPSNFEHTTTVEPTTVMPGETVTVTTTVTNTGSSSGSTTVTIGADGTEIRSESVSLDAGQETTVTAQTQFQTAGPHEITVDGQPVATVQVNAHPTTVGAATLTPDSVPSNTTAQYQLDFAVANISDDGNEDRINVTVPDRATLDGLDDLTLTTESGQTVSIASRATVDGNEISFVVSPDSSSTTRDLAFGTEMTTTAPKVSGDTELDFVVTVSDSAGSTVTRNATLTVTAGNAALPSDPTFNDVLGVIEAFNTDQQYNGVDVSFQDVLAVIEAFNAGP